jgi:peptidoglycan-associated lipoprotein
MHLRLTTPLAIVSLVLGANACKPKYPACETDDHCKEKGEVCVNKQCQECRDDTQCQAKYPAEKRECLDGRCEIKPECRADADCAAVGEGLVCKSGKCVVECTANEDCPAGRKCEAQKCVAECQNDIDCGPNRVCVDGACQDQETGGVKVSAQCRPMNAASGDVINLETVSFEFDQYDLTVTARKALDQNAECLREAPTVKIVTEGHADERGTQEYNLALGEKRAATVRAYLKNLGIETKRMETRSKGENEPVCREASEDCWSQNRRVEFIQER